MADGQEQWCGDCLREWGLLSGEGQRRKNRDNCNTIINKYNLKSPLSHNPMHSRNQWECPAFQQMRASVRHICPCPSFCEAANKEYPPTVPPSWEALGCLAILGCQGYACFLIYS